MRSEIEDLQEPDVSKVNPNLDPIMKKI